MMEQIRQILLSIQTWIRDLQEALQNHAESKHRTDEIERREHFPRQPIRAAIAFDEETIRNAKIEADRKHAIQTSIKNATWAAVGAAAFYAAISALMWGQMIKQNKILFKQLETTSGTILHMSNIYIPADGTHLVNLTLSNWGQITGTDIHGLLETSLWSIPDNKMIGNKRSFSVSIPNIPPIIQHVQPHEPNVLARQYSFFATAEELEAVDSGKAAAVVEFSFSYNNGFRTISDSGDCIAYLGFPAVFLPHETVATGGFTSVPCGGLGQAMIDLETKLRKVQTARQQEKKTN